MRAATVDGAYSGGYTRISPTHHLRVGRIGAIEITATTNRKIAIHEAPDLRPRWDDRLRAFMGRLEAADPGQGAANPYAGAGNPGALRRTNLEVYLQHMRRLQPRVCLVGEAPGFRGCGITGVPFTSPALLAGGVPALGLFGPGSGYAVPCDPNTHPGREQTATVVWDTLAAIGIIPLMWNAFPFHPMQAGNPQSNRKPSRVEVELGGLFLTELLDMFRIEKVVAVGGTAKGALERVCIPCAAVRHPSHGGKSEFVRGLTQQLSGYVPGLDTNIHPISGHEERA